MVPNREQLGRLVQSVLEESSSERCRVMWRSGSDDDGRSCLTIGLPEADPESVSDGDPSHGGPVADVFRRRLIWWPDGLTRRRRVTMISSRTGARHDQQVWWYDLLRTAVLRVNVERECVTTVCGTATHDAAQRASQVFGVPRLSVSVDDRQVDQSELIEWLEQRLASESATGRSMDAGHWRAELSPQLREASLTDSSAVTAEVPGRDAVQCFAGDRSYVLSCRHGGHVHGLLNARLNEVPGKPPLILLAEGPGTTADCHVELVQAGAVPWLVAGVRTDRTQTAQAGSEMSSPTAVSDGPLEQPENWLCHWTRPCFGAWPDQPETDYLDELVLGCDTADRSALATLLRMVSQQTILASEIRRGQRAVSFTEVPLAEFRQRRVYRRHRRRYDFEPWGIAIRRDVLQAAGARPVTYGTAGETRSGVEVESVWYQPATDQAGKIDWREEREWRLASDLRLSRLSDANVCLFVESVAEADVVHRQCSCPVVVVPGTDDRGA